MAADLHHVRADLHSLWNILKEQPEGSDPWKCGNLAKAAMDDLDAIMSAPPIAATDPISATGEAVVALMRALQRDPRYADTGAISKALDALTAALKRRKRTSKDGAINGR